MLSTQSHQAIQANVSLVGPDDSKAYMSTSCAFMKDTDEEIDTGEIEEED